VFFFKGEKMNSEDILLKIKQDCEKVLELIENRQEHSDFENGIKVQARATLSIIKNAILKGKK
jgi:hypothetical protein